MEFIHNINLKPDISGKAIEPSSKSSVSDVSKQFSSYLNEAISEVNQQQLESNRITEQFARGEITDIHHVMITAQKASIALELTVQVRNKVVEAYQEVMRMQI